MGYNATVVVLVDALGEIEKDTSFGKTLAGAISRVSCYRERVDVPAGCHCNAATVIETHHADCTHVVAVGGNYGTDLGNVGGYSHHLPEDKERIVRQLAEELGYNLVKKRETKKYVGLDEWGIKSYRRSKGGGVVPNSYSTKITFCGKVVGEASSVAGDEDSFYFKDADIEEKFRVAASNWWQEVGGVNPDLEGIEAWVQWRANRDKMSVIEFAKEYEKAMNHLCT